MAATNNEEKLLVIQDTDMAAKFAQNWSAQRQHSEPYTGKVGNERSSSHSQK
jgi:hypothetical protein